MSQGTSVMALVAVLALGIAVGVGLGNRAESSQIQQQPQDPAHILQAAFNHASAAAMKSVVHVITIGGAADVEGSKETFGSGVIVGETGQIITNNHVVRFVKTVTVRFVDGSEYTASVAGQDPESDLALLKIDPAGRKLTPMKFTDSEKVRVGDIVFAIGSPFGYNHTVTSGIVSAKHRRVELGKPYEDFIQTDAAINSGNSGGALVNLNGELVGLNSAIGPQGWSSEGIGLAISSNLVKWVLDRLVKDGTVHRGYLGIVPADLTLKSLGESGLLRDRRFKGIKESKDLLDELGLADARGVLVTFVNQDSPAATVLAVNDVVTEIGGKPVRDRHDLFFRIAECEPGQKVKLKFVRDRKPHEVEVALAERPASDPWGRPRR